MANKSIKVPVIKPNQKLVRFCFEYLETDHAKFNISECTKEFFDALFAEIIRYRDWDIDSFMDMNTSDHRHVITFKDTTEPDGFSIEPLQDDIWTDSPWQLGLQGVRGQPSEGWRVHGFLMDEVFHVVWFDPCHRLELDRSRYAKNVD